MVGPVKTRIGRPVADSDRVNAAAAAGFFRALPLVPSSRRVWQRPGPGPVPGPVPSDSESRRVRVRPLPGGSKTLSQAY